MITRIRSIILAASAILIAMVNASTVSAESHISDFIKEGTIWLGKTSEKKVDLINTSPNFNCEKYPKPYRYINGTTVINGVEYMRLCGGIFLLDQIDECSLKDIGEDQYITFQNLPGRANTYGSLLALIRVEDGKIYIYNMRRSCENEEEEILYYDFNMQAGDIRSIKDFNFYYDTDLDSNLNERRFHNVKCVGKGTVTSCGNTFDLLYMSYETGTPGAGQYDERVPHACWIDCIGADNHMMTGSDNLRLGAPLHVMYQDLDLETMICDGKVVYRSSDFTEENITKPDFSNIESLEGDGAALWNSQVYSVDGKPAHPDSSGIKISNGKKYITSGK